MALPLPAAPSGGEPRLEPPKKGLTRRQALAAAVATGLGVGATRLLGGTLDNLGHTSAANQGGSTTDWVSPLRFESARVMQLLRRATFGYSPAQLEAALADGFNRTVDRLLETPPAEPPAFAAAATPGGVFPIEDLQTWWVEHMLSTPTPFAERMTLFWHGLFTSDFRKTSDHTLMYWQNLTWRRFAMKDLRSMLLDVTADPAMLIYLDLVHSQASDPNENFSRELMELFTMGPGNYTEEDVRQGALALTGWQLPRPDTTGYVAAFNRQLPVYTSQKAGVFNRRRAYSGDVTFLGHNGPLDTHGVMDRILQQPATAPFIAGKVAEMFLTARPSKSFVNTVADRFRRSKYDVKTLMHAVFTSPEFSFDSTYRSLVKSPTEMMVHAAFALGDSSLARLIAASGLGMGQRLFDPPDVGGWPNNDSWISSNTVIERVNFVTRALTQVKSLPSSTQLPQQHLDGVVGPQTAKLLNQATDERTRWFVALASPEFQLK